MKSMDMMWCKDLFDINAGKSLIEYPNQAFSDETWVESIYKNERWINHIMFTLITYSIKSILLESKSYISFFYTEIIYLIFSFLQVKKKV